MLLVQAGKAVDEFIAKLVIKLISILIFNTLLYLIASVT
jgi:hypothetical protein